MAQDKNTTLAVIEQFLKLVQKEPEALTDDLPLYGEGLGLDSLEAAELSAVLEDKFGSDPFSAGGDLPQTVGDILGFYEAPATA
ncbi:phosphopantetheine-binding protein [Paraconexibacter antarcticus]|uniref:Phosphopantetheine-binding protein n=1 Tax=Paraconexibacter antarcticus TaxID=2949664 RepID=A0ABY5DN36_9ACTN|nr:phosphopantetheine-binding protein [Paraconexibacter antarcticus]UTI62608.1 phosphopantetheine-binding protein [Paraconexibacter antarcticus]